MLVFTDTIVPLGLGILIYLIFRDTSSLLMNEYLDLPTSNLYVEGLADRNIITRAIAYNLPQGLWVFAGTRFFVILWRDTLTVAARIWILLPLLLSVTHEVSQLYQLLPGWYDVYDLMISFVGFLSANGLICLKKK